MRNLHTHSVLLPSNTAEQLKDFLVNLYVDLLEYLFVVIRIFFKDDGRMSERISLQQIYLLTLLCLGPKSKPALFARMFWSPFESIFSDALSKMQHHHIILGHTIRLADFEKLDDIQKRLHKLDIQVEDWAVKDSTNLHNERNREKDAFAARL